MLTYETIQFTQDFLESFVGGNFTAAERRRLLRAIELLDTNEQHPSLRVHPLRRELRGLWSASASDQLRITFQRLE